jgi:hypothetical protein
MRGVIVVGDTGLDQSSGTMKILAWLTGFSLLPLIGILYLLYTMKRKRKA